jgi:hypothetical protein|tara:strand:+ start:3191 stop:3811 length:621 start_codon:yes stop_codon:yes gene_type:complete
MGFLDNTSITVDAILTKRGRQRLSAGDFRVTKFALSDDEIDYKLYDVTHPNGTDSYGTVIENMNLLEASPNRDGFNSHLVDAKTTGAKLQISPLQYTNIEFGANFTISPTTAGAADELYSFKIGNSGIAAFVDPAGVSSGVFSNIVASAKTAQVSPREFITPTPNATTNILITGLTSGLVGIVSLTVNSSPTGADDALAPQREFDD